MYINDQIEMDGVDLESLQLGDLNLKTKRQKFAMVRPCLTEKSFKLIKALNGWNQDFLKARWIWLYLTISPADKYKTFVWQLAARIQKKNRDEVKRVALWLKEEEMRAAEILHYIVEDVGQGEDVFYRGAFSFSLTKKVSDEEFNFLLKSDDVFNFVIDNNYIQNYETES